MKIKATSFQSTHMTVLTAGLCLVATGCLTGVILMASANLTTTGGPNPAERYGFKVHGTGDLDGDGFGDYVVTAPNPGHDKTYIYFGPHEPVFFPQQDPPPRLVFEGQDGGEAGWAVASGRLSGQGRNLVVAAPGEFGGRGVVYLLNPEKPKEAPLLGDATIGPADAYASLKGDKEADYAGWSVAVGDFNADNKDDLLIGACGDNNLAGSAYVVHGPIPAGQHEIEALAHAKINGISFTDGAFGCSVASADLDGDGQDEAIIGAMKEKADGESTPQWGRVHIFYKIDGGTYTAESVIDDHATIEGAAYFSNFGFSLSGGGDINGDGQEDLAIGAPVDFCHKRLDLQANPNFRCPNLLGNNILVNIPGAAVYAIVGKQGERIQGIKSINDVQSARITEANYEKGFGTSVSISGDLDGDGEDDLLIGSRGSHQAYIYYGRPNFTGNQIITSANAVANFDGSAEAKQAGVSVHIAPDLNNDGYDDVLIGAPGQEWYSGEAGLEAGAAYLFYGEQ